MGCIVWGSGNKGIDGYAAIVLRTQDWGAGSGDLTELARRADLGGRQLQGQGSQGILLTSSLPAIVLGEGGVILCCERAVLTKKTLQ